MLKPMTRQDADAMSSLLCYIDDNVDIGIAGSTAFEELQDLEAEAEYGERRVPLRKATALIRTAATSLGIQIGCGLVDAECGEICGHDVIDLLEYARPFRWKRAA